MLARVGLLAEAGDAADCALLLEPDLGVPELEIFVERGGEEEDGLSCQRHDLLGELGSGLWSLDPSISPHYSKDIGGRRYYGARRSPRLATSRRQ